MYTLIQDIRYGFRTLTRSPGFTAIAVTGLARGIGINTVIFSVVNAVMLRPLPYAQPDRLMMLFHSYPAINLARATVSPIGFVTYHERLKSFDGLAAFTTFRSPQNLTGRGEPERVTSVMVSADFFHTLGIAPHLGRTFTPEEDQPGKAREVVLSYGLWKQRFDGDAAIIGKTIELDGQNYEVIGIMPQGFQMPSESSLWLPIAFTPKEAQSGVEYLQVIGRLKPGVDIGQAQAELANLSAEIVREIPELAPMGFHVASASLPEVYQEDFRTALLVLLGVVGAVLLISCLNAANLLLSRAVARQREIAVRAALGASRLRVIRQLVTESMLLALMGGGLGLLLGYNGLDVMLALVPIEIPSMIHINVDKHVLFFTFALSLLTGLLFGLAPALHISGKQLKEALTQGGRSVAMPGRERIRQTLVVAEVAIALMLLVGAGLLIRTFAHVKHTSTGFDPGNTLSARVSLTSQNYSSPEKIANFYQQLLQRVSTLPGVRKAAIGTSVPLTGGW